MCTAIKINQHICWYANNNCCPTKHRPRGEVFYEKLICENYLKDPHQSFLKFRYLNWCRELFVLYSVLRFWFFKFLSSDICKIFFASKNNMLPFSNKRRGPWFSIDFLGVLLSIAKQSAWIYGQSYIHKKKLYSWWES